MPALRPATPCQSVVPNAVGFVSRLPSPPAKVLPARGPEQDCVVPDAAKSHPLRLSAKLAVGIARPMATVIAAISTCHFRLASRIRREPRPAVAGPSPRVLDALMDPP